MKNFYKIISVVFLSVIFLSQSFAQFKLSAEIRTRAEAVNAYKYLPDSTTKPEYFISQRTRLKANFKKDFYETHISLQDVRVWGAEDKFSKSGVWANTNSFDIYEAWVKFNLNDNNFFKIGRQELKYDDQRLLSWRNWNQYGLTYDAFVYGFRKKDFKMDIGLSYNNDGTAAKNNAYFDGATTRRMKTLDYIHLNKKFGDFNISANYILAGYHKGSSVDTVFLTHTYGAYAQFKNDAFSVTGNAYMQSGKSFNGKEIDGAMMTTLDANVFLMDKKLTAKAGIAYFSGADGSNTDSLYNTKVHTFNLMYGARFKYYGYQNMYTLMDKHTKNAGLTDIHFGVDFKPGKKHIIKLDYHMFSTSNQVFKQLDNAGNREYFDQSLGSEIDLMYLYKISKEVKVRAGFSYYLSNETTESFKGVQGDVGSPFWGWITIHFNPTLFTK